MTPEKGNQKVYIDIDDVLCDTTRAFPALLKEYFGKTVQFDDIHSFDLSISFGLSPDELQEFMGIAHSPHVLRDHKPVDGSIEAVSRFVAKQYEILLVTGRPPSVYDLTEEWVARYNVPYQDLIFVDKYGRYTESDPYPFLLSLEDILGLDICFAVEDSLDMAVFLSKEMGIPVALLDKPWNRHSDLCDPLTEGSVYRCDGWNRVIQSFRDRVINP